MYKCPHCGEPGISKLRKLSLGPALPATCQVCGKKVGVPYSSMLAMFLPFLIAMIAVSFIDSSITKIAVLAVALLVGTIIHMKWVPLERR